MAKGKEQKRKVKFRQSAKIVQKNDATSVARPDTTGMRRAIAEMYRDNSANFKIKIRKK